MRFRSGVLELYIERFDLKAFGRFSNASLDFTDGEGKLHIIFGPNESGKSTSLRAITSWLFGIDSRSSDNYVHPYSDLRVGGKLVSSNFGTLECVRRKGTKNTLKSIDESADIDEKKLTRMLGGMDQETFLRGFGLDRQRLIEGGRDIMCGGGDLGRILFSAGVGMGSLNEIVTAIDKEKRTLFLPTGQVPELNKTLSELKKLRSELNAQTLTAAELQRREKQLVEAKQYATELGKRRSELEKDLSHAQALLKAMPLVVQRSQLIKQLETLKNVPILDDNFRQRRRTAETDRQIAEGQLVLLDEQAANLQASLEKLNRNERILQFADRIKQCADATAVFEAARQKLPKLRLQSEALRASLEELLGKLGKPASTDVKTLSPSDSLSARIERLTKNHVRLEQAIEVNNQAREHVHGQLVNLSTDEDHISVKEPTTLAAVLKAYSNPQRLVDDRAKAQAEVEKVAEKLRQSFARLAGFEGTIEQAQQLTLPVAAVITSSGDQYEAAQAAVQREQEKVEHVESQLQQIEDRIEHLARESNVSTEEELINKREARDHLLKSTVEILSEDKPNIASARVCLQKLAGEIQQIDVMVDRMRAAAEIVARREQANLDRAKTTKQLVAANKSLSQAVDRFEAAKGAWNSIWNACMTEPGDPQSMQQWVVYYEKFADTVQHYKAALAHANQLDSQYHDAIRAIQDALEEIEEQSDSYQKVATNLLVLQARAQQILDSRLTALAQHAEKQKDQKRFQAELTRLETENEKLSTAWQQWRTDWNKVIDDFTEEADVSPDRLRQILATIEAAVDKQRQLSECESQIKEIEESEQRLQETLKLLVDEIEISVDTEEPLSNIMGRVESLLDDAVHVEKQFQSLEKQLSACRTEKKSYAQKASSCSSVLEVLCREVGCNKSDQLPVLEQQATEKREAQLELTQLDKSLLLLSGGPALEPYAKLAMESDAAELNRTIESCELQLQESQERWEAAQQNVGSLQRSYDEMDGSGRAAEINQQIQALEATAARLSKRYSLLAIQQAVLNRAIEAYREQNQGPILLRATEFFEKITCQRYRGLKPYLDDKNQRILLGVRFEEGRETEVRANLMSEGTADALFLSLRLAGLESHIKEHGPVPLVMDDVLVQFDDQRCAAALNVLCEISQLTQVIFFTHHQHLIELVDQRLPSNSFVIHHLEEVESCLN